MTLADPSGQWRPYDDGKTIGTRGSERGVIILDEKYDGARITLERDGSASPFAITCGVSGMMVHTRFFGDEPTARADYNAMKGGLVEIYALVPLDNDPTPDFDPSIAAIHRFIERFP